MKIVILFARCHALFLDEVRLARNEVTRNFCRLASGIETAEDPEDIGSVGLWVVASYVTGVS